VKLHIHTMRHHFVSSRTVNMCQWASTDWLLRIVGPSIWGISLAYATFQKRGVQYQHIWPNRILPPLLFFESSTNDTTCHCCCPQKIKRDIFFQQISMLLIFILSKLFSEWLR
jgi:hypothetical protein